MKYTAWAGHWSGLWCFYLFLGEWQCCWCRESDSCCSQVCSFQNQTNQIIVKKFENIWSVFFCVWTLVHSLGLKLGLDPPSDPEDVEVNPSEMWNLKCVQHTNIEIHQTRVFKDLLKTFAPRITEKLFAFSGGSQQWQQTHCEDAKRAGLLWIWDILSHISRFSIILEAFWQHKFTTQNVFVALFCRDSFP